MKTFSTNPSGEKLNQISCNLCAANETKLFISSKGYRFVKCICCGLVYQNPQPDFDNLRKRYSEEYFNYELENEENFYRLMRLGLKDIDFFNIANSVPNREFLDIGCATGRLLEYMRSQNWKVQGVDLTPQSASYGRNHRKIEIFSGTLEEANFPDSNFGVVHFSHLIEHVPDPKNFLREVDRVLMPGGLLLITTPNIRSFQAILFGSRWRSAIADHVFLFSKKTMKMYLSEFKFNILKIATWGGLPIGSAPNFIKVPIDRLAKIYGFGDVMMFAVKKELC